MNGPLELAGGRVVYHGEARRRPFLHPVRTPSGDLLTCDAPDDHPWHHGLWFALKYVDGDNFWEEMDPYGVVRHDAPPRRVGHADGDQADEVWVGALTWTRPDRSTVALREHRLLAVRSLDAEAYAVDLAVTLRSDADAVLDRTPYTTWGGYGGMTLRGAPEWTDTRFRLGVAGAHPSADWDPEIVDEEPAVGGGNAARLLGVRGRWCDLSGTFPSGRSGGACLLDHPANPRHPTPWYGSTRAALYGDAGWSNFLNAAFLFHEPLVLVGGEPLRVAVRIVVHDGCWSDERADAAWEEWAATDAAALHAVAEAAGE